MSVSLPFRSHSIPVLTNAFILIWRVCPLLWKSFVTSRPSRDTNFNCHNSIHVYITKSLHFSITIFHKILWRRVKKNSDRDRQRVSKLLSEKFVNKTENFWSHDHWRGSVLLGKLALVAIMWSIERVRKSRLITVTLANLSKFRCGPSRQKIQIKIKTKWKSNQVIFKKVRVPERIEIISIPSYTKC